MLILISVYQKLEYEKTQRVTKVDFVSNVGGLFGLCLGCSIISFAEICYWIFKTIVPKNI